MGIKTGGEIEIAAAPETVWQWLVDRKKFAQWAGGDPTWMPEDPAQIVTGYQGAGTLRAPDGERPIEFTVTECEPCTRLAFKQTYAGGESTSAWELSGEGEGTRLSVEHETDYAQAAMPAEAKEQLETMPEYARKLVEEQMKAVTGDMAEGRWDENPLVKKPMQEACDQGLAKLKELAEG